MTRRSESYSGWSVTVLAAASLFSSSGCVVSAVGGMAADTLSAAILNQAIKRRTGELSGPLKVVEDQQGSPTSAEDLAEALLVLACREERESGLLHLCNSGVTTWYDFARGILDRAGFEEIAIDRVPTSTFQTAAPRPAYSVLDCRRAEALGISMPTWTDALDRYLAGPDCPDVLAQFRTRPDRSDRNEVSR